MACYLLSELSCPVVSFVSNLLQNYLRRFIQDCQCQCLGVFSLSWYSQKTRKEFEKIGLQNTNNMWRENELAQAHLCRGSTHIEYLSQKVAQQVWILNCNERHNFCLSDLVTNSNRTTLQSYKVEELTFGTPCTSNFWSFSHVVTSLYFWLICSVRRPNLAIMSLSN